MKSSYPVSQPEPWLQIALFFRARSLHTSMSRLKEASITVRLIASIWTDQFNLQKHPWGREGGRVHLGGIIKGFFCLSAKISNSTLLLFTFRSLVVVIFLPVLHLVCYTSYFERPKQVFEQKPNFQTSLHILYKISNGKPKPKVQVV